MQKRILKRVWEDVEHSKGWFGKVCILALLAFIPIFGQLVLLGFIFGWARDIAWDVQSRLPRKLISREDGSFWKRAWRILLLFIVFAVLPLVLFIIGNTIQSTQYVMTIFGPQPVENSGLALLRTVVVGASVILAIACAVFAAVGAMRISIYNKLSAGFQLRFIGKMLHYDMGGMMRIVGMTAFLTCIGFIVVTLISLLFAYPLIYIATSNYFGSTYPLDMLPYMAQIEQVSFAIQALMYVGPAGFAVSMVILYVFNLFSVFIGLLSVRALGYWTKEFKVPLWGDQKDPLPFELSDAH